MRGKQRTCNACCASGAGAGAGADAGAGAASPATTTLSLADVEYLTERERLWLFGEVKRGLDVDKALLIAKGGSAMVQASMYGQEAATTMLATIVPGAITRAAQLTAAVLVVQRTFRAYLGQQKVSVV